MRKIESESEKEKRESRNKMIIGIILVGVMVLSTAGYAFFGTGDGKSNEGNKVDYNNLDFYKQGDFWQTEISGYKFYFSYLPNDTESPGILMSKTLQNYAGKPLYFTGEGLAEREIAQNLGSFVQRVQLACYASLNCTEDLPEKNCTDNIIVIKESNFTQISEEENCVFIFSNNTIREADAFLFKILGIK